MRAKKSEIALDGYQNFSINHPESHAWRAFPADSPATTETAGSGRQRV
jgi:hypothetical protein